MVFLAILCALRPDVVDLAKARTRSNRQNLEEAFHIAERELHIPRLLDPAGVYVTEPSFFTQQYNAKNITISKILYRFVVINLYVTIRANCVILF